MRYGEAVYLCRVMSLIQLSMEQHETRSLKVNNTAFLPSRLSRKLVLLPLVQNTRMLEQHMHRTVLSKVLEIVVE